MGKVTQAKAVVPLKGEKARKVVLDEAAARKAVNAAAAQEDAMKGECPVIALGKEGKEYVYYSIPHGEVCRLKPSEHKERMCLYSMATRADYARWLEPDISSDALDVKEAKMMRNAGRLLMEKTGGKKFNPDMVRGRGVWRDADGGILYNAGDACFLVRPDGRIERVDGVHEPHIYNTGTPLIHPADDALTDEEGARLVDFYRARPWVLPCAGELVAGWMVCAVLAGVLPYRPQVWVNAPALTGKSALKRDMLRALGGKNEDADKPWCDGAVTGGHAAQFESARTSPAGVYDTIKQDSLPVVFDEPESHSDDGGRKARNMAGVLDILRSAATSGDVGMTKGSADGVKKVYKFRFCAVLFSIANTLCREADTSRFLVLRLSPLMDNAARAAMYESQEAARAMTQGQDFTARLFTRLLRAVPALLNNARAIREHLMTAGYDPRRAELLGLLLAGAHALTKSGAVDEADLEHAAAVAQAVEEGQERESDTQRCLDSLLGYSMPWHGSRISVAQLCKIARDGENLDSRREAGDTLESLGLRWRDDLNDGKGALQVNTAARGLRELYKGTDWESGKVAAVLAEGCKRDKNKKPNALGIWLQSCKVSGRPMWLPMIPAALVMPADG